MDRPGAKSGQETASLMNAVMKFRSIGLLLGVLVGVLVVTNNERPQRAFAAELVPKLEVIRVIGIEPSTETPPPPEFAITVNDLDRRLPTLRNAVLTAPPRRWILRDETWKAMANSRFNLEVDRQPGHEYIGIRVVLPLGS